MLSYMSLSIKAPVTDVEEFDRLSKLKNMNRSQYIRAAFDIYRTNPTRPIVTKENDLTKGEPKRSIALMFDSDQLKDIEYFQEKYKVSKVKIIRQAVTDKALQDGDTYKTLISTPVNPNPKWEGKWVKASNVYSFLKIHRNIFYRMTDGLKTSDVAHPEKSYLLSDMIRVFRLDEHQVKALVDQGTY